MHDLFSSRGAGILCSKLNGSRPWGSSPSCTTISCVTLAKSLHLSGLWFPHIKWWWGG